MGINPSNRGGNNDLWISQTPDPGGEGGVQGSQPSTSGELGTHRVSTSGNGASTGILNRIGAAVRSFFTNLWGRGSASKGQTTTSVPSAASRLSVEATGDARATEGAAVGLQKRGYTPGKPVPTPTAPQVDTTSGSSIAENLKSYLDASIQAKQERTAEISDRIRSRWTDLENSDETSYMLSGLQTLISGLGNTRRALTKELQLSRSGEHDREIEELKSESQSLWSAASKDHEENGESGLFSLLAHLSFGGPSLDSSMKVEDYMEELIELHSDDGFFDNTEQDMLLDFAQNMDNLRGVSENSAQRAWANFISWGEVAVRGVSNRMLAKNAGTYDRSTVQENLDQNLSDLSELQNLNMGVYVTTLGVLASDVL